METRLVLGCGSVGHDVIGRLREGPGDLLVATEDERRAETFRSDGVPTRSLDVGAPTELTEFAAQSTESVGFVAVLSDDPGQNQRAVRAARDAFSDAYVFAYAGEDATASDRETLRELADRTFEPGAALVEHVHGRLGTDAGRIRDLRAALDGIEEPLAIVTHDNPDPDAIASALALERIVAALGHEAEVCYYGDISHQENRALVNLLDYDLLNLDADADLSVYGGFALVDHSRPGVNDGLPTEMHVDVVVDHHPPRGPVDAEFLDLRSDVGATSTLLVDYLQQLDLEVDPTIATGLLFGIRVDTNDFSREVSVRDYEAAAHLLPQADVSALKRIESPSVSVETFELLATAIKNRDVADGMLTTCVGFVSDRDALAQAADHLLDIEGVTATLVYGIREETVYVSARARGVGFDLGESLREAFGQIGSAGGHADMAGAQLSLGVLGDTEASDRERLVEVVDEVVSQRFREVVSTTPPGIPSPSLASTDYYGGE